MNENFFENVYEVTKLIPEGRVTSYGSIGEYLGSKRSARMVGWAMAASHTMPDVPAHRVVNAKGLLTGKTHFTTPEEMGNLLRKEGVIVENDKIIDFEKYFWNPTKELM